MYSAIRNKKINTSVQFANAINGQAINHLRDADFTFDLTPVTSTSDYERIHPGQSPERIF
jgi:hypothetical protein